MFCKQSLIRRPLMIAASVCFLMACDVRKKDKVASVVPSAISNEVKDPTTVEIIDSVYDFGSTNEGEIVQFSYRFKNSGNKPLVINSATASCGCTVPEKPEKPIMPGETGFIKVKFNSDRRPGEARKTISVSSNANPPFPELVLKGTVVGKEK